MRYQKKSIVLCTALLLFISSLPGFSQTAITDFSFIHISDIHAPRDESAGTIATIPQLGSIELTPYKVTAPAPSFVFTTGDLNEFGWGYANSWDALNSYCKDIKIPIYWQSGNHDGTWDTLRPIIRKLYGEPYYSFDFNGCHFISLDSAGLQDPRPVFTKDELTWLAQDLKKVGTETPVFIGFHHPLYTSEFSSPYVREQFLDLIHPYNIAALLVGHGHSAVHTVDEGIDEVEGGSPFGGAPGYSIISIQNGILRVAYRKAKDPDATVALLEKPLATHSDYPSIKLNLPLKSQNGSLRIHAAISNISSEIDSVQYIVDGDKNPHNCDLISEGYEAVLNTTELIPGQHFADVVFHGKDGKIYRKSGQFSVPGNDVHAIWRAELKGSCKGMPTLYGNSVFVGDSTGTVYALNAQTGKTIWSYPTGGDILGQILVVNGTAYAGSLDSKLYALNAKTGKLVWTFTAEKAVCSSPVYSDGLVLFGCNSGAFYALDAKTGSQKWINKDATYTIESKPFIYKGNVYYGAWDTFLHCVNISDGKTVWKKESAGTDRSAARYYSPADCGPAVSEERAFCADRGAELTIFNAKDGVRLDKMDDVTGVGLSADGNSLYLCRTADHFDKTNLSGKTIWKSEIQMGWNLVAPIEYEGVVYQCTDRGLLYAISAADGKVLWQYQVTPKDWVLSSVAACGNNVYVSGMDGTITAIQH